MKRVSTKLWAIAALAMLLWPGHAGASDVGTNGPAAPSAYHEISVELLLAMDANVITLNGFLSYGGVARKPEPWNARIVRLTLRAHASDEAALVTGRTHSIEIASAPNVFTRVRHGFAALRVMGQATECVVAHCWRRLSGNYGGAER